MHTARLYLHDIGKLAEKLSNQFGSLSYDNFSEDRSMIDSAILGFLIMKESWIWLPGTMQKELPTIDWPAVTGRWDPQRRRHVGFKPKELWDTIVQRLPEMGKKVEEQLHSQI